MMTTAILFLLLIAGASVNANNYRIHSHNDEQSSAPLQLALKRGCGSIEVDIFDIMGEFLVGHSYLTLRRDKTLIDMYLKKLPINLKKPPINLKKPLYLFLDFKLEGHLIKSSVEETYHRLNALFSSMPCSIFTSWTPTSMTQGLVNVIMTGATPDPSYVANQQLWYVAIDGSLENMQNYSAYVLPVISVPLPTINLTQVNDLANAVHSLGKKIRIWDHPQDDETVRRLLQETNVDLISVDLREGVTRFARSP